MVLTAILTLIAAPVVTTTRTIELPEVVRLAMENNYDLAIAFVEMKSADAALLRAEGRFDFIFGINGRYDHGPDLLEGIDQLDDGSGGLSITRRLPWNGEVGLGVDGRVAIAHVTGIPDQTEYLASGTLSYRQPLLRGFGFDVAQAEIRGAEMEQKMRALLLRARASAVLQSVEASYWELALAVRDLAIRRSALELAKKQLQITKKQIDVGRLTPVDALAVERAVAQREEELIATRGAVISRSIELRRVAGLPVSDSGELLLAGEIPVPEIQRLDHEAMVAQVIASSPTIAALEREQERAAIEVEAASDGVLPRLDLQLGIGPIGNSSSRKLPDPTFPDALKKLVTFDDFAAGAAVAFELPLGNGAARGELELAELRLARARLATMDIVRRLREQSLVLLTQMRIAARRIGLTKVATRFARESLEAEEKRFNVGRSTIFFVLQRQDELREAQLRELRPIVDYLNARAALDSLSGEILARHGITEIGAPAPVRAP